MEDVCRKSSEGYKRAAPPHRWFYCSTDDNPADIPTRGTKFSELLECSKWWFGPFWLQLPEALWPDQPEVMKSPLTSVSQK